MLGVLFLAIRRLLCLESCFLLLEDSYAWSLVSCYWKTLMLGVLFLAIRRLLCLESCFLLIEDSYAWSLVSCY